MDESHAGSILHRRIGWIGVAVLLVLRIPFTILITYIFPVDSQWGPATFHVGTYSLIAFLIWWERKALHTMNIDSLAVAIILLKPLQTLVLKYLNIDVPLTFPNPAGLALWVIAAGLLLALWVSGYRVGRIEGKAWAWVLCGLLIGVAVSTARNFGAFQINAGLNRPSPVSLPSVATFTGMAILYQLGFASITEEPLFRGLLWGYLRRLGWRDVWIWLAQAGLFMSAHLYFKDGLAFNFWIVVPLAGLILGLIAWRSRSIAPGMLAHAAYNAGAYLILLRLINFH